MAKDQNELLVVSVLEAGVRIDQTVNRILRPFDITNVQYNVLRILNGAFPDALCMSEIKERLLFPNSDLTRLIDRLEGKKLVLRGVCTENRRKVNIFISEKGQDILNETAPQLKLGLNNFFLKEFSKKKAETLRNEMDKISNILKTEMA